MMDLLSEPDHPGLHRLLEVCYQSHLATHRAVKRAGADFTSLGDSPAGPDVVSPAVFARFARPYQERLVRELAAEGIFTVIHICGNTSAILDQLAEYPACGFRTGLQDRRCAGQGYSGPRTRAVRKHRPRRRIGLGHGRGSARGRAPTDREMETRLPLRAERRLRVSRHNPPRQHPRRWWPPRTNSAAMKSKPQRCSAAFGRNQNVDHLISRPHCSLVLSSSSSSSSPLWSSPSGAFDDEEDDEGEDERLVV